VGEATSAISAGWGAGAGWKAGESAERAELAGNGGRCSVEGGELRASRRRRFFCSRRWQSLFVNSHTSIDGRLGMYGVVSVVYGVCILYSVCRKGDRGRGCRASLLSLRHQEPVTMRPKASHERSWGAGGGGCDGVCVRVRGCQGKSKTSGGAGPRVRSGWSIRPVSALYPLCIRSAAALVAVQSLKQDTHLVRIRSESDR
jgi:uncharacterized protein YjeT (DUF2065 family)